MAYSAATGAAASASDPKVGAGVGVFANMAMMAGTGAAMGSAVPGLGTAAGAGIGALVGLATSFSDIGTLLDDGSDRIREALQKTVKVLDENLNHISGSLEKLANYDTMSAKERILEISKLEKKRQETLDALEERDEPVFKKMAKVMKETLPSAGILLSEGVPTPDALRKQQEAIQRFGIEKEQAAIFADSTKGGKIFEKFVYQLPMLSGPGARHSQYNLDRMGTEVCRGESKDLMRGILGPEVIAEMLSRRRRYCGIERSQRKEGRGWIIAFY